MNFSLHELGYIVPLDDCLAQDLIYFENCISEKQKIDSEKMRR